MANTRPSGVPIVEAASLIIAHEVGVIDRRGRFPLRPRWIERIAWWSDSPLDVLMVLDEPGVVRLMDWQTDGLRVVARYEQLRSRRDDEALVALRLLADRYQKLRFDAENRGHISEPALAHLGLPLDREANATVYVAIYPDHIAVLSPSYRNAALLRGSPLLDDLP
jgi:hypothetical protein